MSAERPAKKARLGESYYKQIDGVKYDRELLEKAEAFAKDGQVSYPEAKKLWEETQDGSGVTEIEKLTLEYTLKTLKYSDKAANFMKVFLAEPSKSYYKQIDGVKYDAQLLQKAEQFAADGQISFEEAKDLMDDAEDGKGMTDIEKKTLEYTLKTFTYTEKAAAFIKECITPSPKGPKSYYKQIDGVKYDRALLEKAEEFAKDGQVSYQEAKQLIADAQDGKGITEVEKRTLRFLFTGKK